MSNRLGGFSGSRADAPSPSAGSRPIGFDPGRKHAFDYEVIEWRFVARHRRKGWIDRDFFIGTRRYRHFASGANERGVIRHGYLIGEL